jgi:ATPase subunit of ABC transporter with duplicated ATPase domains
LALLHESCHEKLHKNKLEKALTRNKQYKASTFMSIIHNKFQEYKYETTYGYITSAKRKELGLEKSHANDAFIISGGTTQEFSKPYQVIQKRKNNRSLQLNRKGFKPSIRKQHYIYQPHDLVEFKGEICKVIGTHNCGKTIQIRNKFGEKKEANAKKIISIYHTNGLVWYF